MPFWIKHVFYMAVVEYGKVICESQVVTFEYLISYLLLKVIEFYNLFWVVLLMRVRLFKHHCAVHLSFKVNEPSRLDNCLAG